VSQTVRPQTPIVHQGCIRMFRDGPHEGYWIAYCTGCDWQVGPQPINPSLGEAAREHERGKEGT